MPVAFLDAAPRQCRFPVSGEGLSLIVCGEPARDGKAYCADCHAKAYRPATAPRPVSCSYVRPLAPEADRALDLVEALS